MAAQALQDALGLLRLENVALSRRSTASWVGGCRGCAPNPRHGLASWATLPRSAPSGGLVNMLAGFNLQPGAGSDAPCKPVANGCEAHVEVPQRDDMKLWEALKRARESKATATLLVDASQTAAGECVEPAGVCPRTPPNAPLTRGRTLSVRRAFSSSTVLITGATGYLGSLVRLAALPPLRAEPFVPPGLLCGPERGCRLVTAVAEGDRWARAQVLEQLLRLVPDVKRIYVIVRGKRGLSGAPSVLGCAASLQRAHRLLLCCVLRAAQQWHRQAASEATGCARAGEARVDRLLARSLFHMHREKGMFRADLRAKIVVVPGDLLRPRCGLSAADEQRLAAEVDFVVHSAACISFDEHIHNMLAQNLQVAPRAPQAVPDPLMSRAACAADWLRARQKGLRSEPRPVPRRRPSWWRSWRGA